MLKPDLSHFAEVETVGGKSRGTSFSTALIAPLAAQAMMRLRDASPDLVKALLIHNGDHPFDPNLGFGTPAADPLPWECRPGFVTLVWTDTLRPGDAVLLGTPNSSLTSQNGHTQGPWHPDSCPQSPSHGV